MGLGLEGERAEDRGRDRFARIWQVAEDQETLAGMMNHGDVVNANYSSPSVTIKTHHFTGLPFVFHSSFH